MVAWNTHIFIFGWFENILMGISFVNILFFNCQMELAYTPVGGFSCVPKDFPWLVSS